MLVLLARELFGRSNAAGAVCAAALLLNVNEVTRVHKHSTLRENYASPFLWLSVLSMARALAPRGGGGGAPGAAAVWPDALPRRLRRALIGSTLLLLASWQFGQFLVLLQLLALLAVYLLGGVPRAVVLDILASQAFAIGLGAAVTGLAPMLLASLALAFAVAAHDGVRRGWVAPAPGRAHRLLGVVAGCAAVAAAAGGLKWAAGRAMGVGADAHVFSILGAQLGLADASFDSALYLCGEAYRPLPGWVLRNLAASGLLWRAGAVAAAVCVAAAADGSREFCRRNAGLVWTALLALAHAALAGFLMRMMMVMTPLLCVLGRCVCALRGGGGGRAPLTQPLPSVAVSWRPRSMKSSRARGGRARLLRRRSASMAVPSSRGRGCLRRRGGGRRSSRTPSSRPCAPR